MRHCALALATPLATSLEALAQVKLMGFDKTGTLTSGRVRLTGVETDGRASEAEILQRAAALEQSSEHPLARGILDANQADPLPPGSVTQVRAEPGKGIVGLVSGEQTAAGTITLTHELAWLFPSALNERLSSLETVGYTRVYVGWNGRVHGVLLLNDLPRPEAPEEGKWFATAKEIKLYDLALELASRTHCDPKTLTRAARDYLDSEPAFALGSAMAALRWLSEGWGYEVTRVDVVEAYDRAMDAAARLNNIDDVTEQIRQLVESSDNASTQFVRQALQGRLRATRQAISL